MEHSEYQKQIFQKYLDGTATPAEEAELAVLFRQENIPSELRRLVMDAMLVIPQPDAEKAADTAAAIARVKMKLVSNIEEVSKPPRSMRLLPYAAAILIAVSAAAWMFFGDQMANHLPVGGQGKTQMAGAHDIAPGTNRATLTLADGRTISLDEAQTGIVVGLADITYQDGASLGLSPAAADEITTFTLTTPKGGTYQITLPDGTVVWLNAASTMNYPNRFANHERHVEISGEAYFSVAKDSLRPFKVTSKGQRVEVLGTEFNISAYDDDHETKTTLIEGKVRVAGLDTQTPARPVPVNLVPDKPGVTLLPGQQSVARAAKIDVREVDTESYVSWKSGRFHFKRTPLEDVLKQVSRWYDVEVVYQKGIPKETFSGKISRNVTLMGVLDILKVSAVDISLSDNRIVVD